jgi:ribosomal protein L25 (general stress protein Ctc)
MFKQIIEKILSWFKKDKNKNLAIEANIIENSFEENVTNNPITVTIDGKTYNTTNQEEIAEILKYLGEQLRAKK